MANSVFGNPTLGGTNTWTGSNTFSNPILLPAGSAAAPSLAFAANSGTGLYQRATGILSVTLNGALAYDFQAAQFVNFTDSLWMGASNDVKLKRLGAGILGQIDADVAQEFRVYGATTGAKYLSLRHDGTDARIASSLGALYLTPASTGVILSSGSFIWAGDGGGDFGAAAYGRPNNVYVKTRLYSPTATFSALPPYANDAAAGVGGLTTGMLYQVTGTGVVMVKQ